MSARSIYRVLSSHRNSTGTLVLSDRNSACTDPSPVWSPDQVPWRSPVFDASAPSMVPPIRPEPASRFAWSSALTRSVLPAVEVSGLRLVSEVEQEAASSMATVAATTRPIRYVHLEALIGEAFHIAAES